MEGFISFAAKLGLVQYLNTCRFVPSCSFIGDKRYAVCLAVHIYIHCTADRQIVQVICLVLVRILLVGGASGIKSFACSLLLRPVINVSLFPSWNLVVAGMLYCLAELIVISISGGSRGPLSGSPAPCDPRLYTWLATHVDLSDAVLGFTGLPAGKSWEALVV